MKLKLRSKLIECLQELMIENQFDMNSHFHDKLVEILRRYGCTPDETIYIGSKINDRKCCQMIPKSFCPDDAGHYLKDICWAEFTIEGGRGIMSELLYLLTKNGTI